MPPVKKKQATSSHSVNGTLSAVEGVVLSYLQEKNRPYSVNDLVANLHNKYTKTVVQKILGTLVDSKKVTEKNYGKQTVYVASQDNSVIPTSEELDEMDARLATLKEVNENLLLDQKALSSELQQLTGRPTITILRDQIIHLNEVIMVMEKRLEKLTTISQTVPLVDVKERKALDASLTILVKQAKQRERMCLSVVETISEGLGVPPIEAMETLGIERP